MNTIAHFLDKYNIVLELFLVGIMCGMVAMIEFRNGLIKELKEENKELRNLREKLKSKRKSI